MAFIVLMPVFRKEGLSPADFKKHYEDVHVPLISSIFGDLMPARYTRHYVDRSKDPPHDATMLIGQASDVPYDCLTELAFADQEKLDAFNAVFYKPEIQEKIQGDEANFMQHDKMMAVKLEDVCESRYGSKL
ncbi:MAG: hypothetical protein M1828_006184 [Chrysothrix sp. TS-e1954]|nr:MAG: hypothetical protein M1828_006184 [Chrysothrix sp. TS-e1954]